MTPTDSSLADRQGRFAARIEPFRPALEAYCRTLTRSTWEADDLVQDTCLKAYSMFLRGQVRDDMSKAYLFRIAYNTWIDHCRKERVPVDALNDEQDSLPDAEADPIELQGAMETLIAELPARQRVLLLLVDIFGFTASEAARMIVSTEGAVKAVLHRARAKLKTLNREQAGAEAKPGAPAERRVDESLVYAYLKAFRQHNPYALVRLLNEETELDLIPVVAGSAAKAVSENSLPAVKLQLPHHSQAVLPAYTSKALGSLLLTA